MMDKANEGTLTNKSGTHLKDKDQSLSSELSSKDFSSSELSFKWYNISPSYSYSFSVSMSVSTSVFLSSAWSKLSMRNSLDQTKAGFLLAGEVWLVCLQVAYVWPLTSLWQRRSQRLNYSQLVPRLAGPCETFPSLQHI